MVPKTYDVITYEAPVYVEEEEGDIVDVPDRIAPCGAGGGNARDGPYMRMERARRERNENK